MKENNLISEKHKKTCKYLNYFEQLLILDSVVTGCFSISAFASLVCFIRIRRCATTAGIKNYKSIIKKEEEEA